MTFLKIFEIFTIYGVPCLRFPSIPFPDYTDLKLYTTALSGDSIFLV